MWLIEKTIDLARPPIVKAEAPYLLMVPGDENAHQWKITVHLNGQPASLSGFTATGVFQRHDGTLVTCSGDNATIDGNVVTITFRAECYNVPGGMRGAVRLNGSSGTVTLTDQAFLVQPAFDGDIVVDEYIPSLPELLANLSRLEQSNSAAMLMATVTGIISARLEGTKLIVERVNVTDEDAYEAAQAAGYEGTEAEWNTFLAAVLNNTAMITQANTTAQNALAASEGKATVTTATVTALASGWSENSPFTQTINCSIATATNNLIVGSGGPLTNDQKSAYDQANIECTGQGAGTITLTAYGAKPSVDLPVNVMGVN